MPKTAGTSIYELLSDQTGMKKLKNPTLVLRNLPEREDARNITTGHMDPDFLIKTGVFSPDQLEAATSVSIVRNPYSRILSLYRHFSRLTRYAPQFTLIDFLQSVEARKDTFGPWNSAGYSTASPMVRWVKPTLWSGPKNVLRFEEPSREAISAAFSTSLRKPIPRSNSDPATKPHEWLEREIEIIQRLYREDFIEFDYSPGPDLMSGS